MFCATPIVKGFKKAPAKPIHAAVRTIWNPTTLSYPKATAIAAPKGIKGMVSSANPNAAPTKVNKNVMITRSGVSLPSIFRTMLRIPASKAPVPLITCMAPDIRKINAIIPADLLIPFGIACSRCHTDGIHGRWTSGRSGPAGNCRSLILSLQYPEFVQRMSGQQILGPP